MLPIDVITHQQLDYFFYPNWDAAAFLLLAMPLASVFSIELNVIVSSRVSDVRTANQFGALTVIPFGALYVLGEINVVQLTANTMLILSTVLLPLDILLFFASRSIFRRDQILTEWK
jgi:ABC-2 type transport system permease protein